MIWQKKTLVRVNFSFFAQCWNCRNCLSHFFRKNFVKAMVLRKKLLNNWFDEIFFSEREFLVFPQYVVCLWWKITILPNISWNKIDNISNWRRWINRILVWFHRIFVILVSLKNISSNQFFSDNADTYTKFLQKICETNFL